jgi:hypothetical protein
VVGLVIIGGIKRIGAVTGRLVPFMCVIYLLAAGYVLLTNLGAIPAMLGEIVSSGLPPFLGGSSHEPTGAFMGGAFGFAAMWGVKRALFSSEAGQGSAPIAHSAAKTDEPVREGVVAGLEPFIDTLVVCTLTALVIMSSGAWNRGSEASSPTRPELVNPVRFVLVEEDTSILASLGLKSKDKSITGLVVEEDADSVTMLVAGAKDRPLRTYERSEISQEKTDAARTAEIERLQKSNAEKDPDISTTPLSAPGAYFPVLDQWMPDQMRVPARTADAKRISGAWAGGDGLFVVVDMGSAQASGFSVERLTGTLRSHEVEVDGAEPVEELLVSWTPLSSRVKPTWREGGEQFEFYGDYAGASLTAHAFDRVTPGLGQWLVTLAAWLFALSTMISWAYYGEQGVVYLVGEKLILPYKLIYCVLIIVSTLGFISTDKQLDDWTTLGLGVMLVANIPIMLIFGSRAMCAYHDYMKRFKSGLMHPHAAPPITDVAEGKDVE